MTTFSFHRGLRTELFGSCLTDPRNESRGGSWGGSRGAGGRGRSRGGSRGTGGRGRSKGRSRGGSRGGSRGRVQGWIQGSGVGWGPSASLQRDAGLGTTDARFRPAKRSAVRAQITLTIVCRKSPETWESVCVCVCVCTCVCVCVQVEDVLQETLPRKQLQRQICVRTE